ncbi:MAG: tRNA (adenosine(37)-N6)-dimethylallyltransferase MiaA, partial [Clostridiales bacterium]|nr:tRNA (adenosine(37)-N6)-dimethylallyltransferase MiaA [Clostridiales bacterium]
GTGLYVQHLLDNIKLTQTPSDPEIRAQLHKRLEAEGAEVLLNELYGVDPQTAERLHVNDTQRIIRALELYSSSGITLSEQTALSRSEPSPYNTLYIGLDFRDRARLYERIDLRVDKMLADGLVQEAARFRALDGASTAAQAIGYKELEPCFTGECTLEHAISELKKSTRRYAKRQLTWFRRNDAVNWLFVDEYDAFSSLAFEAQTLTECFLR